MEVNASIDSIESNAKIHVQPSSPCFTSDMQTSDGPILLIDGECVLCNRSAQFVIRHDPQRLFRFAPLQSRAAQNLLQARQLPPPPSGTMVLLQNGQAHYRSEAVLRTLSQLPFPWNLARIGLWLPRQLRDTMYNLVARHRIRLFGSTTSCGLLTPAERTRLIREEDIPA